MAIKKHKLGRVMGLTRDKAKAAMAIKMNAVDYASRNIKGIIQGSDIVFICYPIHLIVPEIKKIIQFVKPGTIITDVGSTKEWIVKEAEKIIPKNVFFVGGHPMAGKEKTGLEHAEADLFEGKKYILTKTGKTNIKALNALKELLKKIGADVIILDPKKHDGCVAGISHLTVAVAASLIDEVMSAGKFKPLMEQLASSGFRDATRIASGESDLGTDMFMTNKEAILAHLKIFKKSLAKIEALIKKGDPKEIKLKLSRIKAFRDSIYK